jgi:hypothetical protein
MVGALTVGTNIFVRRLKRFDTRAMENNNDTSLQNRSLPVEPRSFEANQVVYEALLLQCQLSKADT